MERADIKLGIGLPVVNRAVDRDFFLSFAAMEKSNCIIYAPEREVYGFPGDIAKVRNGLVNQALMDGCTHIAMCDTDQIYPQNTIMRLLEHDVDVVGAMVHRRYPPFAPILYRGEINQYKYVPYDEMYSGDLVEVDATGCGCILYKMEVFINMLPPWFELGTSAEGKPIGEDIGFCSRLRSAGFRIFVDTSIQLDHLTTFRVNRGTYDLFRKIHLPNGAGPEQ